MTAWLRCRGEHYSYGLDRVRLPRGSRVGGKNNSSAASGSTFILGFQGWDQTGLRFSLDYVSPRVGIAGELGKELLRQRA